MDSTLLASHGNSIGSFDLQSFQRHLDDYPNGDGEEEENALSSAIESRESSPPQTPDLGPFDLSLLHINTNKSQPTPSASRDTTASNSPSKFTTVESDPQTVRCISQCMGASFRGQTTPRQYIQVNTFGYLSTSSQHQSIPILLTPLGNPNFSNPSYPPQVTSSLLPSPVDDAWHLRQGQAPLAPMDHKIPDNSSSHPRTSTPTSRPISSTYQHLTPHPLPRRHTRVQQVKPTHCCQPTASRPSQSTTSKPCAHTSTPSSPTAI